MAYRGRLRNIGAVRSFGAGKGCCDGGAEPDDCCGGYQRALALRGDDEVTLRDRLSSETVSTASAIALTYHGYKRTGSILWALVYGLAGRAVPLVAVPVAVAQGFGTKKGS